MDCTSKDFIMKSNTSVFCIIVVVGCFKRPSEGNSYTFVDFLTCLLLLRLCLSLSVLKSLIYCYEIVAALQKISTTLPQFLLAASFASLQIHFFIIALFRAFTSLFQGNAGYIM